MADVIFGGSYNLLDRRDYRYVVDSIVSSNVRVGVLLQAPRMTLARLDKWLFPRAIKARNMFVRFVTRLVNETTALDPATRRDISSILSTATDPRTGEKLQPVDIVAESNSWGYRR